jgi:hypothetical protein
MCASRNIRYGYLLWVEFGILENKRVRLSRAMRQLAFRLILFPLVMANK